MTIIKMVLYLCAAGLACGDVVGILRRYFSALSLPSCPERREHRGLSGARDAARQTGKRPPRLALNTGDPALWGDGGHL